MKLSSTLLAAAAGMCIAVPATAQTVYDWPDSEVGVIVQEGSSVFLVGKDKTVWRVYSWKGASGKEAQTAFFTDMNGDSSPDIVGAGKPSFGLKSNGDPVWFSSGGCDQVLVDDFYGGDKKKDLVCVKGKKVSAHTDDWQEIWSISVGRSYDGCRSADINGDLRADVECKWKGSKRWTRIDGSTGDALAAEADSAEIAEPNKVGVEPVGKAPLDGSAQFDFDGDGTAEESLLVDGNAVAVRSRSKKVGLGRIELGAAPLAAVVKDLDGDKKLDIVLVTKKEIIVSSPDGKDAKKFPLNAKKYKRAPVAELTSVYANGFADDAAAQKAVHDMQDKLASCYSTQVKKNQFAGVGQALLEVKVDAKGKVTKVEQHHSSMADKSVVKCAQGALKKGKFPAASGDSASVNVTLKYTFRDK